VHNRLTQRSSGPNESPPKQHLYIGSDVFVQDRDRDTQTDHATDHRPIYAMHAMRHETAPKLQKVEL